MADLRVRDVIEQKTQEKTEVLTNPKTNDEDFMKNLLDLCTLNLLSDKLPKKD